jgi:site-specific DNA recombinase
LLKKRGKQITINGKDYEENPENKLALSLLGLFSEYERAKIMERTSRGRLHRLRSGKLASGGSGTFGYDYVRKTPNAPATLAINEEQAAIIRSIFEMFASGTFGLITICRYLEERRILTKRGRRRWDNDRIKYLLTNETYAGTRYFNRITIATEANLRGRQLIRGRSVYRDRAEWIAVKVPAIISRELFDKVQEKLAEHKQRYCTPPTHYLLSRLVACGVCGGRCSSSRRHSRIVRPSGKVSVYHQSAYRCTRQSKENMHDRTQFERCGNSEIATHMLEGKVFEMIEQTMVDPARLRCCIDGGGGVDDRRVAQQLARVAEKLKALDDERRRIIGVYAAEQMSGEEYITANRALDKDLERLTRAKTALAAALRSSQHEDFVDASIRQFCANANVRFRASADFDAKRQFLVDHVEGVIFNRGKVTITGFVPIQAASGETKLQFRIKGEIKQVARRGNAADTVRRNQPDQIWPEVGALGLQKALSAVA